MTEIAEIESQMTYLIALMDNEHDKESMLYKMLEKNKQELAKKMLEEQNKKIEEYKKIIKSEIKMALIHAPPQVGKTNATKDFIEICLDSGLSVIVSCDNKTNQMDQYDRMTEYFDGRENVVLVKASDSKFVNIVTEAFKSLKNVIIFCLDNSAQIFLKKLYHIEFIRIQV